MAIRNSQPGSFIPTGLTDAIDQDSSFAGACQSLSNLVFDRQNRGAVVARPGVTAATAFPGFTSPGVISVMIDVGSRIYGMIATGRNAAYDEPFCYDTVSGLFVTISDVLSTNVPTTPPSTGAWLPPTMDVIGTKIIVTHQGFSGANFFGWFDISGFTSAPTVTTTSGSKTLTAVSTTTGASAGMAVTGAGIPAGSYIVSTTANTITLNQAATASATVAAAVTGGSFAAPMWCAGNTTVNALPSIPLWVVQFFGRAYFGCKNAIVFTDTLSATTISNTNFTSALTLGDTTSTTGAAGLPFNNGSSGILQSLIVFKANAIYQVVGDVTGTGTTALSLNTISQNVGCIMPRTAQPTMYGVLFIGSDGPRLINTSGALQYLTSEQSGTPDIVIPFSNATTPSRACAAYNNGVYRVALDTVYRNLTNSFASFQAADFWYDFLVNRWNGAHSFQYHCVVPVGASFYLSSNTSPGILFISPVVGSPNSAYLDNSVTYTCTLLSATMPDVAPMSQKAIVESTVELSGVSSQASYVITAYNDQYSQLSVNTVVLGAGVIKWGAVKWGQSAWASSYIGTHPYSIPWSNPIVFKKLIYSITAPAAQSVSIRETAFRYQVLGYTNG
ncbi:hypothetical protein [Glaciimonas immobilis]|uniref:Uncharacterized protein n=1 Tax=Glaciimonas immobilis TaxID=728004 RepID=A0A840RVS2_9BURK|nr:hypothetical protein [Glaciimonas immobilis]KAF3997550.1 hypothetical protein HAV38_12795 [Glaciimonas immobilis]MBB5200764.1 hypothetical protein [Glaciimonas immobilis]